MLRTRREVRDERKERLRVEEEVVAEDGGSVLSKDLSYLPRQGDTFRKVPDPGKVISEYTLLSSGRKNV